MPSPDPRLDALWQLEHAIAGKNRPGALAALEAIEKHTVGGDFGRITEVFEETLLEVIRELGPAKRMQLFRQLVEEAVE
jgi:hypothetical protein